MADRKCFREWLDNMGLIHDTFATFAVIDDYFSVWQCDTHVHVELQSSATSSEGSRVA